MPVIHKDRNGKVQFTEFTIAAFNEAEEQTQFGLEVELSGIGKYWHREGDAHTPARFWRRKGPLAVVDNKSNTEAEGWPRIIKIAA